MIVLAKIRDCGLEERRCVMHLPDSWQRGVVVENRVMEAGEHNAGGSNTTVRACEQWGVLLSFKILLCYGVNEPHNLAFRLNDDEAAAVLDQKVCWDDVVLA